MAEAVDVQLKQVGADSFGCTDRREMHLEARARGMWWEAASRESSVSPSPLWLHIVSLPVHGMMVPAWMKEASGPNNKWVGSKDDGAHTFHSSLLQYLDRPNTYQQIPVKKMTGESPKGWRIARFTLVV